LETEDGRRKPKLLLLQQNRNFRNRKQLAQSRVAIIDTKTEEKKTKECSNINRRGIFQLFQNFDTFSCDL
jgi:hypothetical protein